MTPTYLKCKIAGLNILINLLYESNRLILQSDKYACDFPNKADFEIGFNNAFFENRIKEHPELTHSEAEYIWTGYEFCRRLLDFDGLVLHASSVAYKGKAYLFSAPSGTGKSTHAAIWERVFGSDAVVINDDKPALRFVDGKIFVYGTPWSGKNNKNSNISVPLGGICFISKSESNHIEKADMKSATALVLGQTLRYPSHDFMDKLLSFLDTHLPHMPVFKMGCNMENEAAVMSYEFMYRNSKGDDFYEN